MTTLFGVRSPLQIPFYPSGKTPSFARTWKTLPVLGKLSLAKLWESAYNETVYAAFFWSCLETMVKTGGVCVVENQALVDVWGAAIAYRRMGLAVL